MKIKWMPAPEGVGWNRLKALRKDRKLSQTELAVGAGVSLGTIYHIECGHDERTSQATKEKIALFFDCDVEDIFPVSMIGNAPRKG